jgi:quercetin dioxygenase-like cupin family protein
MFTSNETTGGPSKKAVMVRRVAYVTSIAASLLVGALLWGGFSSRAANHDSGAAVKTVFSGKLPNVPGKSLTAVVVSYTPGEKSAQHRHAGSVFAYVLSGAIRSQNSVTGPARVYKTGESFFEPAGSVHLVSENASTTKPASLLAIFVADNGAQLTTFDK